MLCCVYSLVVLVLASCLLLLFDRIVVYGCEDFTHPLGREEKFRVKELIGLDHLVENLGVWAPLYAIIIHILLGGDKGSMVEMRNFMEYRLQGTYS